MPRLIDHRQRRAELAEAVWRVLDREGVGGVSVRRVAAEAGVSSGSLRHVLPSKELMLAAAMERVVERATERFMARAARPLRTRRDAIALLEEMLPLDDERRLELRTHLALVLSSAGHDRHDSQRGSLRAGLDDAVRQGCQRVLTTCRDAGLLGPDLDVAAETTRLHVLLDGLALHLLGPAQRINARQARSILDEHLAALSRGDRGTPD